MTDPRSTVKAYAIGSAVIAGLAYLNGRRITDCILIVLLGAALPIFVLGWEQVFHDNDDERS